MRDPFYDTPEWREFRPRIRARDGNRCTVGWLLGGACSGRLDVNHIIPVKERPDLRLDPDNCATACSSHHPRWEALRRAILKQREADTALPPCNHRHPYREGREECLRRRMRDAGLLEDSQLAAAV